jgi:hypothetical protein
MKIQWGTIQKSGFLISIIVTGVIVKIIVRPTLIVLFIDPLSCGAASYCVV